MNTGI